LRRAPFSGCLHNAVVSCKCIEVIVLFEIHDKYLNV
jgi:hypothetical protein